MATFVCTRLGSLVGLLAVVCLGVVTALLVHADSGFDSALFGDTNADRANACAQPALGWSASMAAIAQQRAQDIANSGDFSNRLEMSYGAENIGWTSGVTDPGQAAATVNRAYMDSPDHRANICDPRWNVAGIGSVFRSSWNGKQNVWIDAVEFTNASGGAGGGSHPVAPVVPAAPRPAPLSPSVPGTGAAG